MARGKEKFFKFMEKSGIFTLSTGKLTFKIKVRGN